MKRTRKTPGVALRTTRGVRTIVTGTIVVRALPMQHGRCVSALKNVSKKEDVSL